jgi:hypothetical protein
MLALSRYQNLTGTKYSFGWVCQQLWVLCTHGFRYEAFISFHWSYEGGFNLLVPGGCGTVFLVVELLGCHCLRDIGYFSVCWELACSGLFGQLLPRLTVGGLDWMSDYPGFSEPKFFEQATVSLCYRVRGQLITFQGCWWAEPLIHLNY